MDWMVEHQRSWRLFELGLLILAIFGPWAFDRIVVPADYPCDTAIRLEVIIVAFRCRDCGCFGRR